MGEGGGEKGIGKPTIPPHPNPLLPKERELKQFFGGRQRGAGLFNPKSVLGPGVVLFVDGLQTALVHVGVNLRRADVHVAEHLLDRAEVRAAL